MSAHFFFRIRRRPLNSTLVKKTAAWILGIGLVICISQPDAAMASKSVEPGLETAVSWKWKVIPPPTGAWGIADREVPIPTIRSQHPHARQATHVVRQGEVLINIARLHKLTTAELKEYNNLDSDFIRIGQRLRIPNAAERMTLRSTRKSTAPNPTQQAAGPLNSEVYVLRLFLESHGYSTGPIRDTPDEVFGKVLHRYQTASGNFIDHQEIVSRARESIRTPAIQYELKPDDFAYISPAKAVPANGTAPVTTYNEMTQSPLLAYRTPWEFVAERYNVDEVFLRKINPALPPYPPAGSVFLVPNVTPFEIEQIPFLKQPPTDTDSKVTARVSGLTVLEILNEGSPIAAMPISRVRPGLRGSGEWRILDAIPRPALATLREPRVRHVEKRSPFYTNPNPTPPIEKPVLSREEILSPGPNNPLGVAWINLSKDGSTPLPFGLHGSSNPSTVSEFESLGGFRLSNRDIVRAIQLLPPGTPLTWGP